MVKAVTEPSPITVETLDINDALHATVRGVALATGLQLAFLGFGPGGPRGTMLGALALFAVYSVVGYLLGWRLVPHRFTPWVYVGLAGLDLALVAFLLNFVDGGVASLSYALYFWVATVALVFGTVGGIVGALVAFATVIVSRPIDVFLSEPWPTGIHAVVLLAQGTIVGLLSDRLRSRAAALRRSRSHLDSARRRVTEEEAKLAHADRLSSIGVLAAGVAHEISNPLSGVMGCVKALRDPEMPDERKAEYFETIRDGLDRIERTVRGLLEFAKQAAPQPNDLDLSDVVAACTRLVAPAMHEKTITLHSDLDAYPASVHADRSQLMQALINVMLNAVYVAPPESDIRITAREEGDRIGVAISDDGAGIAPHELHRVCDPFFTTKPEGQGTGLGLSVTLGIVRAHGGDLTIDSVEGRGTTVTIWLPRASQEDSHA
jgi:signal transduction histidine kinase